jgi:hypothetical protein
MFSSNNDIKIVCKLENDDTNEIKISGIVGSVYDYNKVKITTLASNISIKDLFDFGSIVYFRDHTNNSIAYHKYDAGKYKHISDILGRDPCFEFSDQNKKYEYMTSNSQKIIIDPKSILTLDGKSIDVGTYRQLYIQKGSSINGPLGLIKNVDLYKSSGNHVLEKVGELPTIYPAFYIPKNELATLFHKDDNILYHKPITYFTLESKNGNQYGYFSDKNGNPTSTSLYNKISLDCTTLDLMQLANIEELAQKNLELEECHSAALNTAQIKGKAISEVVNRVKRQVEEGAKDEIVDGVKSKVTQDAAYQAAYQTAQSIISSDKSDVIGQAANLTYGSIIKNDNDRVIEKAALRIANEPSVSKAVAAELRRDPGNAKGPQGDRGPEGPKGTIGPAGPQGLAGQRGFQGQKGANAQEVATELVTKKASELGKAVIDADSNDQGKSLSTRITYWLKDLLKNDQDFQGNVADELLDRTNENSIVSEVAKRINKRSVEDRAVRKVTDKVDVQDVVEKVNPKDIGDKIDPEKFTQGVVDKLKPSEAKTIAEATVNAIKSPDSFGKYTEFSQKLAELLFNKSGMNPSEALAFLKEPKRISDWGLAKYLVLEAAKPENAADKDKFITGLLNRISLRSSNIDEIVKIITSGVKSLNQEQIESIISQINLSQNDQQEIIALLTDPNNTELIIKAFAEKYPEIDIESIIRNLQRSHVHRSFNVRGALKQTEEAIEKVEEDRQQAERANNLKIQDIESNIQSLRASPPQSGSLIQPGASKQEIDEAKKKAEEAAKKAENAQRSAEAARDSAEQSAQNAENSAKKSEVSAKESKNSAESAENTLHDIQQHRSNFDRESSGIIERASRVRRSTEELRDSTEESEGKAKEDQKWAENARNTAQDFANQAKNSAEVATSAKDSSISSMHDLAQRYSNLNKDKSDISKNSYRIKRSIETENANEETTQTLSMHDIRRLLEKETSGAVRIANQTRRETEGIKDLVELELQESAETRKNSKYFAENARKSAEKAAREGRGINKDIDEAIDKMGSIRETTQDFANQAGNSAVNSHDIFQDILQSRSNFDREKNDVISRTSRVRRSTEELRDSTEESTKKAVNVHKIGQKMLEMQLKVLQIKQKVHQKRLY